MTFYETQSEDETGEVAAQMAKTAKRGDVFLLSGNLGAGKSVFARAFIRALCGEETDVPSPTFTLVQTYDSESGAIWHFDLYRLKDPDEIYEIGWEDALADGITLVEWPERLGSHTPKNVKRIQIETLGLESRTITLHD